MNLFADVFIKGQIITTGKGISPIDHGLLANLTMTGLSRHFDHTLKFERKHKYNDNENEMIHHWWTTRVWEMFGNKKFEIF